MNRGICLLDLDGTLTDPSMGIFGCIEHAFDALGRPAPARSALRGWIGPPLLESFEAALGDGAAAKAALAAYRERFDAVGWCENELIAGIEAALEELAGRDQTCHVVTSKPQVFAERIVAHFGLDRWIDQVFGSELDGRRSDKAELIEHCLAGVAGRRAGTCMIGDRRHDVRGARQAGVRAVGVLWGFGGREELVEAGAHAIAMEPGELAGLVASASPRRRRGLRTPSSNSERKHTRRVQA